MIKNSNIIIALILSLFAIASSYSAEADEVALHDWQIKRLLEPSASAKQREQQGHIMTYHRLTDVEVTYALDTQFSRIQSMMFTDTIITDTSGNPSYDSATGEMLFEEDGCD